MKFEWIEAVPGRFEYRNVDSNHTCVAQVQRFRDSYIARLFKRRRAAKVATFANLSAAKAFVETSIENPSILK